MRLNGIKVPIMDNSMKTPEELQKHLGERLRALRISQNFSQVELASKANISLKTLRNLEHGGGSSVETLVRTLKALDQADALDLLAPIPTVSPMAILRNANPPHRVRRSRRSA